MNEIVNVYPILPGKTDFVRERFASRPARFDNPEGQKALNAYRAALGYSEASFWLQHLPGQDYLVVNVRGEGLVEDEMWSAYSAQLASGCPGAIDVNTFYLEALGVDLSVDSARPGKEHVCGVVADFSDEELDGLTTKKYAFCYPLQEGRGEDLKRLYTALSMDADKGQEWIDSHKKLGIVEASTWVQHSAAGDYIVVAQEVIDPLRGSREQWLEESIGDNITGQLAEIYSMLTGLAHMQLVPDIESLTEPETAFETRWELEEMR